MVRADLRGREPAGLASGVVVVTGGEARGFVQGSDGRCRQRGLPGWLARWRARGRMRSRSIASEVGSCWREPRTAGPCMPLMRCWIGSACGSSPPQFDFYEGHAEYVPQWSTVSVKLS